MNARGRICVTAGRALALMAVFATSEPSICNFLGSAESHQSPSSFYNLSSLSTPGAVGLYSYLIWDVLAAGKCADWLTNSTGSLSCRSRYMKHRACVRSILFAVDTLLTKVLHGTLRILAQAFFCCRRPVTSVISLQSVRPVFRVDSLALINIDATVAATVAVILAVNVAVSCNGQWIFDKRPHRM